jgi:predicted acyl esterase
MDLRTTLSRRPRLWLYSLLLVAVALLVAGLGASLLSWAGSSGSASVNRTGYITISGGVKLAYDLTLPGASGRFPVALEYDHYLVGSDNGAEVAGTDAGDLLAAGFAVLGVNQPGSGCSGGINDIVDVNEWGRAGAQVIDWAARQPWSTGHVGMFGDSWPGISQLGVASFRPKGLDAIAPFHVAADFYRDVAYPGGVYEPGFMNYYAAGLVKVDAQAAHIRIAHGDRQCARNFRAHVPANRKYSIATNMPAHPFDDSYWKATPASRAGRIDVPILGCQSWQDGVVSSRAMELYENTFNPKTTWFIGMNGPHGICEFSQPLGMVVRFLQHYVAGVNNGWQNTPHVMILHDVSGGTTSPASPAWTSTYKGWSGLIRPVTLYFRPNSSLATSPPPGTAGRSSFSGPHPSQSGRWAPAPAPGSSVSYTTPPLARTVDFFGPGSVNLWLSSTAPDTDIEVIISEVRPDGMQQYVQAGWLDVAQRKLAAAGTGADQASPLRPYQTHLRSDRQPLAAGKPVYARVELFPFEHVFRKGSSIRITVDSAMGRVQSTGLWGLTGPRTPVTDTVYAGPSQRSQVVLGLIPGATAKAPLPACGTIAGEPCRRNTVPVPAGRLTIP